MSLTEKVGKLHVVEHPAEIDVKERFKNIKNKKSKN